MSDTGREIGANGRHLPWYLGAVRAGFRLLERLAPGLAGPAAVRLFRTVRRFRTPNRERFWLLSAERFELRAGRQRLAAWSWGRGPAVLLVHGWEGRGSQMGAFVEPLVEAGFRVVTFDAPGHGGSNGRTSSLPQFTAAVRAAAAAVGPLAAIVAHSFGAAGTGWAKRSGLEAERLVFVAAPWDLEIYIRFFSRLVGLSERGRERMLAAFQRRFGLDWEEARFATTVAADRTPLLLVHDEQDPDCPYEGGRRILAAWPEAELMSTRGLGHTRILRDPRVVSRVAEFIAAAGADRCAGSEAALAAAPAERCRYSNPKSSTSKTSIPAGAPSWPW